MLASPTRLWLSRFFAARLQCRGDGTLHYALRMCLSILLFLTSVLTTSALHLANPIPRYALKVYIEDTDAYSVVYWANYLRFIERAAVAAVGPDVIGSAFSASPQRLFGLQSASGIKYSVAARLGDACEVALENLGFDDSGRLAMKAALLRSSDGVELWSASDLRFGFTDTSNGERVEQWPIDGSVDEVDSPADPCDKPVGEAPAASISPRLEPAGLILQADEASPSGAVDLHAAALYFERHRTTYLGGPEGLEALARDNGINVVVARINQLRLLPPAYTTRLGAPLDVRCEIKIKARGSQVVFDQWLVHGETSEPLAKGEVTCLIIDPSAGKIVPAPAAVLEQTMKWQQS